MRINAESFQIETLPTRSTDIQPLQNVLSISTAAKNRYLLHFNSLHSLTQWTAAIRLAMYENATLQEAYTGSLIAGKGKLLNNIRTIMDRTRVRSEDWARVRFGAGTPWRRCWCVITPPDEKEVQKQQKQLRKKSAYERSPPALKGTVKFYDTKKTKKAQPIATINDAYSAYALYPQSKPLIDQSTLIKLEGHITIHSVPETPMEGFIFVMPELHAAVSGFEMLLRFLFPLYDVFALYGRPNRLIADTIDTRSLMFALPQEKRYGYLEILDVATLIHEDGSQSWSEKEWRKRLKDLTSQRMTRIAASGGRARSRASSYRGYRSSVASRGSGLRFEDGASIKSTPSLHHQLQEEMAPLPPPHKPESAPPQQPNGPFAPPQRPSFQHQRSFSENSSPVTLRHNRSLYNGQERDRISPRLSHEQSRPSYEAQQRPAMSYDPSPPHTSYDQPPLPPVHAVPVGAGAIMVPQKNTYEVDTPNSLSSTESDPRYGEADGGISPELRQDMSPVPPPAFVAAPPAFVHEPGAQPKKRPGISPDLRRANSRLSVTTLSQLADVSRTTSAGKDAAAGAAAAWRSNSRSSRNDSYSEEQGQRGVMNAASQSRNNADRSYSAEGLAVAKARNGAPNGVVPRNISANSSLQDPQTIPYYKDKPLMSEYDLLTPRDSPTRNVSPLSQTSNLNDDPVLQPPIENLKKPVPTLSSPLRQQSDSPLSQVPTTSQRPQPSRSSTSHSITRKPVASKTPPRTSPQRQPDPPAPKPKSSYEDLHTQYVDEEALAQVLERTNTHSLTSEIHPAVRDDKSSVYDNDSTVSPDYASTAPRKSTETRRSARSIDKPRRGVLKTVGTVEPEPQKGVQLGDYTYKPTVQQEAVAPSDIPVVDFGPTQAYKPIASSHQHATSDESKAMLEQSRSQTPERMTPSPNGDAPSQLRSSPANPSNQPRNSAERSPGRKLTTPEPLPRPESTGSETDNRRSVAWQPGAAIGGGSPGARKSLTPEQFVQQRAAANRITPIYAHGPKPSSPTPPNASRQSLGEMTMAQRYTPPPNPAQKRQSSYGNDMPGPLASQKRQSSYGNDMPAALANQKRQSSYGTEVPAAAPLVNQKRQSSYSNDMAPRPHSRGPSNLINSSADYSAHLSAREQEHVARVTGSPLINMAANSNKNTGPPGSGLVAAIDAREREKRGIKEGLSSQMVQHAIAQRQQHERSHQARQPSYSNSNPQYAMPGGYPPSPGHQQPPFAAAAAPQAYPWGAQPVQYQQQQMQMQPQYQQPQQLWTPPSAGTISGGYQQQQYHQQTQYPLHQQQQQQQQHHQQQAMWHQHQQQQSPPPQGFYGQPPQQQQAYYGPYFGNGNGNGQGGGR